jgi:hypothetical protein
VIKNHLIVIISHLREKNICRNVNKKENRKEKKININTYINTANKKKNRMTQTKSTGC